MIGWVSLFLSRKQCDGGLWRKMAYGFFLVSKYHLFVTLGRGVARRFVPFSVYSKSGLIWRRIELLTSGQEPQNIIGPPLP